MKTYIALVRDHSISMQSLAREAVKDYNNTVAAIREASKGEDTIIFTVKCGTGRAYPAGIELEAVNSSVYALKPLPENSYTTEGRSTPLFDSVGLAIESLKSVPDYHNPNVAFLVQVVTDGEENSSNAWARDRLKKEIQELQKTDRWTFVFRVPVGYGNTLKSFGVPAGNIYEWDTTSSAGLTKSSQDTVSAFKSYYTARHSGVRSTSGFYSDAASLSPSEVKNSMKDITHEVSIWEVQEKTDIKSFTEAHTGHFIIGAGFYQLTKKEKAVQDYKPILVRNKLTGRVYAGARSILGLPDQGTIALNPGDHGEWDVFIQSTSNNRNLMPSTQFIYWPNYILSSGVK